MKTLSVIMPAYMKEEVIAKALFETEDVLKGFGMPYEIIVVDDGSKDKTREEAEKYNSKYVKVVGYKKNTGKGHALKYGFKYVKGDIVAFIDADTDLHPDQIAHFLY